MPAPRIGPPPALTRDEIDAVVGPALAEDQRGPAGTGRGDITSNIVVPENARAAGRLVCKGTGRLAGLDVFARVIELCDPNAKVEVAARDGDAIEPKQVLLRVHGRARSLLVDERTAIG